MKILQISSAPVSYLGGTEKVVWEISKRFAKDNEVTILQTTLYEPKKSIGTSFQKNIKIITCKNDSFLGGYGYSKEFKKKLKEIWKDYDLVHIHGYGRFTSDFTLKFLKNKKPMIFTAHGFFHSKKAALFKKMHNTLRGRLIKNASFCTALTKLEEKEYIRKGLNKNKIRIIPNGVDLKRFDTKSSIQLKKKYSENKKILLHVGRIHKSKGLNHVLKAIKNIDLKFLIVGIDTGYKKELIKIASNLNISKKIKFIEKPDDKLLTKIFLMADIFVLFSEWEGFGIVVIESMAAGKPVIVSDRGALPFLITNNKEGLIIPFGDVKKLEDGIRNLLKNAAKARRMGKNGIKRGKNFDWNKIVGVYLNIYKIAQRKFNG